MTWLIRSFLRHPQPEHFAAIDIGSNKAIRSLRFDVQGQERVAMRKFSFELPERTRETDLIPLIGEHLRRLLFELVREMQSIPKRVLIGLGSHFTFNEMAVARRSRARAREPIRLPELEGMLAEFVGSHRDRTVAGGRYTLVHLMPFRIAVDGYPVATITRSTRGNLLEITLLATYALDSYWNMLDGLRRTLGGIDVRFMSNQAAVAAVLTSLLEIQDALLVKIGARTTEVSLLSGGSILFTGQFDSGGDIVTRAIAERLKIDIRSAERTKRQWDQASLPAAARLAAADAMRTAVARWQNELTSFLKRDERFMLPERAFIFGGGARLGELYRALTEARWFDGLTFLEKLDIQRLDAETIASRIFRNSDPLLHGPEDVALSALAARVNHQGDRDDAARHEIRTSTTHAR